MRRILLFLLAFLLCGPIVATASDEISTALEWNSQADPAQCQLTQNAVWADYQDGQDCIRYYASGDLMHARTVIVMLYGDRVAELRKKADDIPNNTPQAQIRRARTMEKQAGVPVVVLARPGTYGSSGNHFRRRQAEEFLALDAALDEIKNRYRIQHLVLLGHSGGATAAAALLTLGRSDIACAVLTSGAFDLLERAKVLRLAKGNPPREGRDTTGLRNPYDPLEHVGEVRQDPERQVYVIGDPRDKVTPFYLQVRFAKALQELGHQITVISHKAKPPSYHNLSGNIGLNTAADCAKRQIKSGREINETGP